MNPIVKLLRVLLPIVFIAFVVLIAVSFTRGKSEKKEANDDESHTVLRKDDTPAIVMKTFEDTQSVGGRLISRIRATRTIGFKSGWYTLEGIELTIYGEGNVSYTITADHAEFNPDSKEADAAGGVALKSSEGVELKTAAIRFDGTEVVNKVPVDFKIGGWTGTAGGIRLRVHEETLYLVDGIKASLEAANPADRAELVAGQASSNQRTGEVGFDGNVKLTRASEVLCADAVRATAQRDTHRITALSGMGNVLVHLLKGSSLVAGGDELLGEGETRITADRFVADIPAGGQVKGIVLLGENMPVHAIMEGKPRREMTAAQIRIAFNDARVVSGIDADGKGSLQEQGEVPRAIDAEKIHVDFDQATQKVKSALFEQAVRFRDPKTEGRADAATYDIVGDHIVLSSTGGTAPSLTSEGSSLKATVIEVYPKAGQLKGTGAVVARYEPRKNSPADGAFFGEPGKPVYVNAASVLVRQAAKQAVFTGSVKAWQDLNTIFADELQVNDSGEELNARGNVRSVLRQTGEPSAQPQLINTKSDNLSAKKSTKVVTMEGKVSLEDDGRLLEAQRTAFFFDKNQKIDRVESEGGVVLTEQKTGRKAKGDKAIYRVPQKTIRVTGNPAILSDSSGEMKGAEILFDTGSQKVEVLGGEATYNPR